MLVVWAREKIQAVRNWQTSVWVCSFFHSLLTIQYDTAWNIEIQVDVWPAHRDLLWPGEFSGASRSVSGNKQAMIKSWPLLVNYMMTNKVPVSMKPTIVLFFFFIIIIIIIPTTTVLALASVGTAVRLVFPISRSVKHHVQTVIRLFAKSWRRRRMKLLLRIQSQSIQDGLYPLFNFLHWQNQVVLMITSTKDFLPVTLSSLSRPFSPRHWSKLWLTQVQSVSSSSPWHCSSVC